MPISDATSPPDADVPSTSVSDDDSPQRVGYDAWVRLERAAWAWRVHPEWRGLFDSPQLLDWTNIDSDPRASLVKSNDARSVWRVAFGEHALFVKLSRPKGVLARLRRRLAGSDAERECRVAEDASRRGIDTVRPVATGNGALHGRAASILITIGLRDAQPLMDLWSSLADAARLSRAIRNELIENTAKLVAHAHHHDFLHDDLHAGNVLIQTTGGGRRPVFVDLQSVRAGHRVSDDEAIVNLIQFNQWFRFHTTVFDRVRFLDRYLHCRKSLAAGEATPGLLHGDRRSLLKRLELQVSNHARALNAKRDRRALREGRYFASLRLANRWRARVFLQTKHPIDGSRTVSLRCSRDQWRAWLADPARLVEPHEAGAVLKSSASVTVCRATLPLGDEPPLEIICKRSTPSSFLKRLPFVPSRAMRGWRRGHALLHRRIPTACPLAVVEHRRMGLLVDNLLITERIIGQDLDTLLTLGMHDMQPAYRRAVKRGLCASLATVLRRLWDNGYTHDDFKATNVIVQDRAANDDGIRVFLIDLDGLRSDPAGGASPDLDLLARLNVSVDHCKRVSLADRARFLEAVSRRLGSRRGAWRLAWREIARRSDVIRAHREDKHRRNLAAYGRI